jgi:carboxypeptidase family protein
MGFRRAAAVAVVVNLVAVVLHAARAQTPAPAPVSAVQVRVRDSAGVAVGGAEVAVVRGLNDVRGSATTDGRGTAAVRITAAAGDEYQLVVRKIGYARADRFVTLDHDSLTFDIPLRRSVQSLAPVVVSAEQDIERKAYHIDADEIARSDRVLIDATDILAKLRPDMICGRSCRPMAAAAARTMAPVRKCPTLAFSPVRRCPVDNSPPSLETNVWVNGRRIRIVPLDEMALARQHGVLGGLKPGSMTVLSEIKPEHIAEMIYADEFDTSVGKTGSDSALFIILKPGVAYEPGRPSYVAMPESRASSEPAHDSTSSVAPLPQYRYRLLGVFDALTGDPIVGAQVVDLTTGSFIQSSATGTVSLVFLSEGTTPVRIRMAGYEDLDIPVEISPDATRPLTLLMQRKAPF